MCISGDRISRARVSGLSSLLAFDARGFSRFCFVFEDVVLFIRHPLFNSFEDYSLLILGTGVL